MKDEFETEIRTRKSNGPTIRGRAATYVKETFNPVKLAFAYREGHRVFTALESLQMDFDLDAAFKAWWNGGNLDGHLGFSKDAVIDAFDAGSQDAKDRSTKILRDPEPNMFENETGKEPCGIELFAPNGDRVPLQAKLGDGINAGIIIQPIKKEDNAISKSK